MTDRGRFAFTAMRGFEPAICWPATSIPARAKTLCGIVIVAAGFVVGFNPLLVVTVAALANGVAAGLNIVTVIAALGHAFTQNRYVGIVWLVLPVIGLLERSGLRERAQALITNLRQATTSRILILYFLIRHEFRGL